MYVQDLMTKTVVYCRPDDTLALAASRMWEVDCGVMPVLRSDGLSSASCPAGWRRRARISARVFWNPVR